ncbi:MAG: ABC transporter ATP-binding protein [Anaerolineales bacterium]|nr:ABC transporter ATP-binding protein [Anaerolineales bacterium]
MLEVNSIHTYYGLSHVLQSVSLRVDEGEVVALVGRNGAGKSTTLKSIMGITPISAGSIIFQGKEISRLDVHLIPRLGISYVPEERRIFGGLSVYENLKVATLAYKKHIDPEVGIEEMFALFPRLKERRRQDAKSLSGGEQQMLATARGLIAKPKILLVDEPTQGLAPVYVRTIMETLTEIRITGVGILLVEQNADIALDIADRAYVLDQGEVQFEGTAAEVKQNEDIRKNFLTI